jgi:hypothetical protein
MKRTFLIYALLLGGCLWLAPGCGKKRDARAEIALPKSPSDLPKTRFDPRSPGNSNQMIEWAKERYVGGYQQAGTKSPAWDSSVMDALEEYAHLRITGKARDPGESDYLETRLRKAINAGCSDPFVRYLYLRRVSHSSGPITPQVAAEYAQLTAQMDASGYGTLLKFYVNLRAAEAWRAAYTKQAPEVNRYRRAAMNQLQAILTGEDIPPRLAYEACRDLYDAIDQNKKLRTDFYQSVEPLLLGRWANEGFPYLIKGNFYLDYAWEARGKGWAGEVTKDGWKLFGDRLDIAGEALDRAWKKDPSLPETPLAGLRLELGAGRGREQMELWYQRALTFPQDRYDAVRQKLWYLQPRWYGSEEECLAFAREVVKSDRFYGQTPLHLYHTHESLAAYVKSSRPNYWTEPQVWPDIVASFERYFELNGEDNSWRHNYALCAWRCRQWKVFVEQVDKLTTVNFEYFGGQDSFERMVRTARERAKQAE